MAESWVSVSLLEYDCIFEKHAKMEWHVPSDDWIGCVYTTKSRSIVNITGDGRWPFTRVWLIVGFAGSRFVSEAIKATGPPVICWCGKWAWGSTIGARPWADKMVHFRPYGGGSIAMKGCTGSASGIGRKLSSRHKQRV